MVSPEDETIASLWACLIALTVVVYMVIILFAWKIKKLDDEIIYLKAVISVRK